MGADQPVPVDFRLVTATHQDLRRAVQLGNFRADLYFRVAVLDLDLPPLRERGYDIIELAQHFVDHAAAGSRVVIRPSAVDRLMSAGWPGNVRQLRNVMLRALVVAGGGPIEAEHLGTACEEVGRARTSDERHLEEFRDSAIPRIPGGRATVEDARSGLMEIARAVRRAGGNRSRAAAELGISRSTLYSRLERYRGLCAGAEALPEKPSLAV